MTEWTGARYGFYTEKPIAQVFGALQRAAAALGYRCDRSAYADEQWLLFYKDEEMLGRHMREGYGVGDGGEGCFGVEAKPARLHGKASLFEFEGRADFEPCDIHLVFDEVFYYLLVVPGLLEDCSFSRQVHALFKDVVVRAVGPEGNPLSRQ
jgi:hypothetical protein